MMPFRRALGLVCWIATAASLAAGYISFGLWITMAVVLIAALTGVSAWREPSTWAPALALGVIVCLAVAGVLSGALPFLMILCSTLALAGWDLAMLDRDLVKGAVTKRATQLENKHYATLGLALLPGLLAAVASKVVSVQIPFGIMILLVGLALFSFVQVWRVLIGKG